MVDLLQAPTLRFGGHEVKGTDVAGAGRREAVQFLLRQGRMEIEDRAKLESMSSEIAEVLRRVAGLERIAKKAAFPGVGSGCARLRRGAVRRAA
jgi:hypothetical protein